MNRTERSGTPTVLTLDQVHYIKRKIGASKDTQVQVEEESIEHGHVDNLYTLLESKGASYVSLFSEKKQPETATGEATEKIFNEICIADHPSERSLVDPNHEQELYQQASAHRAARGISDQQQMMIGIAWVLPFELRQFRLFHVVLHIDATAKSNKEGWPLVTVTSKDSRNRMFTILRAFMPNEKKSSYKWLFSTVFPSLFGCETLRGVHAVVTDGDAQEIATIKEAISAFCPKAICIRCSWHIIDRGWKNHVSSLKLGTSRKTRKSVWQLASNGEVCLETKHYVARVIYHWMFSWSQPMYCITKKEYETSKAIFIVYIQSQAVKKALGEAESDALLEFVQHHVFSHENSFVYHTRHEVYHMEVHTNTAHEGTNNGIKHCSAPIRPQNSLDKAARALSLGASLHQSSTSMDVC